MATKLFLRSTTNRVSGFNDLETTAGSASTTGVVNTTASGTEIEWTATAGGSVLTFVSGRTPSAGFTLSGLVSYSFWAQESNGLANATIRAKIFKRTPDGTETQVGSNAQSGTELTTSATERTFSMTPGTGVAFAENDRLVLRLYITNVGTMGGGRTCTLTYNAADAATGDSFVQINETVSFKAETADNSGTIAKTLGAVTSSASGSHIHAVGTLASTLGPVTSTATGTFEASTVSGTIAATLTDVISAASGSVGVSGSGSPTVGPVTSTATGSLIFSGTVAGTLGPVTSTATGGVGVSGSIARVLEAVAAAAAGSVGVSGTISKTLDAVVSGATGSVGVSGTAASVLSAVVSNASGTFTEGGSPVTGAIASTLSAVVSSASGSVGVQGSIASTLGAVASNASGSQSFVGTIAAVLGPVTSTATGTAESYNVSGSIATTLGPVVCDATGAFSIAVTGTCNVAIGPVQCDADGQFTFMANSGKLNRAALRSMVRQQLQDPSARWWTDTQLNEYIEDWQREVNTKLELVKGTATTTITGNQFPDVYNGARVEFVYANGRPLPYKNPNELDELSRTWRWEIGTRPSAFTKVENGTMVFWPAPSEPVELDFQYVKEPTFSHDGIAMEIPAYCKYSVVPYCCMRAYMSLGHNFDLRRYARYKAKFDRWMKIFKSIKESAWPADYTAFYMATPEERKLMQRGIIEEVTMPATVIRPALAEGTLSGLINGSNTVYTVGGGNFIMLFKNNELMDDGVDFTITNNTITMAVAPSPGSVLIAYVTGSTGDGSGGGGGTGAPPTIEIPSGAVNGVNNVFTVSVTPTVMVLIVNGVTLIEGVHFTRTGTTCTITATEAIPATGDSITAMIWS